MTEERKCDYSDFGEFHRQILALVNARKALLEYFPEDEIEELFDQARDIIFTRLVGYLFIKEHNLIKEEANEG